MSYCIQQMRRFGSTVGLACGIALTFLVPLAAAAQATASITGSTKDANSHQPLAGAVVTIPTLSRSSTADASGRFVHAALEKGSYVLQVHAVGYIPTVRSVDVSPGTNVVQDFELTAVPSRLPEMVVKGTRGASVGRRFEDFERRRASGRGQFMTRNQIESKSALSLADLVRDMRGIHTECVGFTCIVETSRSMRGCVPAYFVDGRRSTTFGPSTPVRDIEGLEVYLGPSETPAEYLGSDSSCGVIALWTKSSPY